MSEDQERSKNQLVMLEQMLVKQRTDHQLSPNIIAHLQKSAIFLNELFRGYTQLPLRIILKDVRNIASVEALPPDDGGTLFMLMDIKGLETKMISYVNRDTIAFLLDLLLGNNGITEPPASKKITTIEKKLAKFTVQELIKIITDEKSDLNYLKISVNDLITKLPILIAEGELGQCFEITYAIRIDEKEAYLNLLMPEQAFDVQRVRPNRQLINEHERQKLLWNQRLKAEISRAAIRLDAVLDEKSIAFAELLRLQVGQVLPLNATTQDRISVVSNGKSVMQCSLGKANGYYTLRVECVHDDSN
jgi:flagellar motor switch protein FliM